MIYYLSRESVVRLLHHARKATEQKWGENLRDVPQEKDKRGPIKVPVYSCMN